MCLPFGTTNLWFHKSILLSIVGTAIIVQAIVRPILVWVVLIGLVIVIVMIVIQVLRCFTRVTVDLFTVIVVPALGLDELVGFTTDKSEVEQVNTSHEGRSAAQRTPSEVP